MRVLNAMQLQVELPMTLFIDNKGAVDFSNNWSIGGRTTHIEEAGLLEIKWKKGEDMPSDILTKNCDGATFGKHLPKFVGYAEYMKHNTHKGRVSEAKDCEYCE
eukprot:8577645-Ditylum_brightwellii.AAC.1